MSSIPAAVDALLGLVTTVMPAGVQVVDGEVGTYVANEQVEVLGVTGAQDAREIGTMAREETFGVECRVRTYAGDMSVRDRRVRAFELLGLVETALRDRTTATLGGLVRWAQVTDIALVQGVASNGGTAAEITFTVSCQARI